MQDERGSLGIGGGGAAQAGTGDIVLQPQKKPFPKRVVLAIVAVAVVGIGVAAFVLIPQIVDRANRDELRSALGDYRGLLFGQDENISEQYDAMAAHLAEEYDARQEYFGSLSGAFDRVMDRAGRVFAADSEQMEQLRGYETALGNLVGLVAVHLDFLNAADGYELLEWYIGGGLSGAMEVMEEEIANSIVDGEVADDVAVYNKNFLDVIAYYDEHGCLDDGEVAEEALDADCMRNNLDGMMEIVGRIRGVKDRVGAAEMGYLRVVLDAKRLEVEI